MFIDVSRWQGIIHWPRVKAAGVTCAIIRVATGTRLDDQFRRNWDGAHAAGLERIGWYHYFIPTDDGLPQAAAVLEFTGGDFGTEPPTVDCERRRLANGLPESVDRPRYTANLRRYLTALEAYDPRIYTSKPEWQALTTLPDWIIEYDLWLAAYPGPPELPAKATGYTVHQYTDKGRVDGIDANVDLNRERVAPAPPEPSSPVAGRLNRIALLADDAREALG